jgi:hypothetical protein
MWLLRTTEFCTVVYLSNGLVMPEGTELSLHNRKELRSTSKLGLTGPLHTRRRLLSH